jgi:hypothetical protein
MGLPGAWPLTDTARCLIGEPLLGALPRLGDEGAERRLLVYSWPTGKGEGPRLIAAPACAFAGLGTDTTALKRVTCSSCWVRSSCCRRLAACWWAAAASIMADSMACCAASAPATTCSAKVTTHGIMLHWLMGRGAVPGASPHGRWTGGRRLARPPQPMQEAAPSAGGTHTGDNEHHGGWVSCSAERVSNTQACVQPPCVHAETLDITPLRQAHLHAHICCARLLHDQGPHAHKLLLQGIHFVPGSLQLHPCHFLPGTHDTQTLGTQSPGAHHLANIGTRAPG